MVAPMNWMRLGWQSLAAMSISVWKSWRLCREI